MIHEQCKTCKHCAWVDIIRTCKGKIWICECMRPKFWGKVDEDGKECEHYLICCWEDDKEKE